MQRWLRRSTLHPTRPTHSRAVPRQIPLPTQQSQCSRAAKQERREAADCLERKPPRRPAIQRCAPLGLRRRFASAPMIGSCDLAYKQSIGPWSNRPPRQLSTPLWRARRVARPKNDGILMSGQTAVNFSTRPCAPHAPYAVALVQPSRAQFFDQMIQVIETPQVSQGSSYLGLSR